MADTAAIFKAYDIRGVVPDQLDAELTARIGAAFAEVLGRPESIVVAYDMRVSSAELSQAFRDGVTSRGVDVVDVGLASTDELYFASGLLKVPGAMFTASHNPPEYGGIKLCRAEAAPVGQDTGLADIRRLAEQAALDSFGEPYDGEPGKVVQRDVLQEYAEHLRSLVDLSGGRRLKVAVDAGNGMAGHTVPVVLEGLDVELIPMYFELDGTFPNHEANPIEPANLVDLQAKVRETGADIGLAFDGDADRCWVIDERGESVPPSAITALVAVRELARDPGSTIIYNLITSRAVPEIVREHGGVPVRSRVGHSFIKAMMAETGAIFGGEHSAHFYFRDFWRADSGMLAALHALAALGSDERPLSEVVAAYTRYSASGEINTKVSEPSEVIRRVFLSYGKKQGVELDELDGLTALHEAEPMWWFNLRPSNTEPVLRLNVEGADEATMARVRDEVLAIVGDNT